MAWLDLVVPSAAILALFGVVALVVVAVLQGRKVRHLEDRLARSGDAAEEAPLQRIAELQARHAVSSGTPGASGSLRMAGIIGLVALALFAAIGGVWYLFVRDDGGGGAQAGTPATTASTSTTPAQPPTPVDTTLVPENVPDVPDRSIYTIAVFNATGIAGAAGDVVAPALVNEGWSIPPELIANEPNALTGLKESVVMFTRGKRRVAQNVAKDLGVTRAPPLDGYTPDQIGDADVVVVVGLDLANGAATVTTP
ncbi:MAG: LytR C-terminal domain-containing protein [Thermoleophilia bacterium]|nr:LytR C-terminal domain-containing protein [Thermoleophilia bacterium]